MLNLIILGILALVLQGVGQYIYLKHYVSSGQFDIDKRLDDVSKRN